MRYVRLSNRAYLGRADVTSLEQSVEVAVSKVAGFCGFSQ